MAVRGVGFVGMRTERLDETVALFRDVVGARLVRQARGLAGFELADGSVFELYGPDDPFHVFFKTGPVVGFEVEDFDATRQAMIEAGIEFIGEVQIAGGRKWQHFHCPDGTVAEIIGRA